MKNKKMKKIIAMFIALITISMFSAVSMAATTVAVPANFTAEQTSHTSVKLSWNSVKNADGYVLYKKGKTEDSYTKIASITNGSTVTYKKTGLQLGHKYRFRIQAYKLENSKKVYGSYSYVNITLIPKRVSTVYAKAMGSGKISLGWNKVNGVKGYIIYRATAKTGPYSQIAAIGNVDTNHYTDIKKLSPSSRYYYKVAAYKVAYSERVVGPESNIVYATTFEEGSDEESHIDVKSISLSGTSEIIEGKYFTLGVTYSPSNATFQKCTFKSSNTKVATVSAGGKVTAVKAGTAKITATSLDGKANKTFTVTVRPKTGFYNDKYGYLHYNLNGEAVKGKTVNGIKLNSKGIYSTGDSELDKLMYAVIKKNVNDDMTQKEKFRTLYKWVCNNYSYLTTEYIPVGQTGWANRLAKNALTTKQGNCYNYAATVTIFGRACGFNMKEVSGYCFGYVSRHGWSEIKIGDVTYMCDAQIEGVYAKRNGYNWDLFMKKSTSMPITYRYI